ncbi:MAG: hypothetical protein AMXMBFR82_43220 [Candidatus Hydrogenedentota bacterium]
MAESIDIRLRDLVDRVRRVQRWLVVLIVLRTVAAAACVLILFVGAFSLLDHRFHFGPAPRVLALLLLLGGLVAVIYWSGRALVRQFTAHQAANYIERFRSYDQQLVTAVEYFENRTDYPYSKALAERLVLQVDESSRNVDFTETVPKWQAYAACVAIFAGTIVLAVALFSNATYFSRYFARLTQPLSTIEPVPATTLETTSGDITSPPDVNISLAARVDGHVPEEATLRVVADAGDSEPESIVKEILLSPALDEAGGARISTMTSLPVGSYRYQFRGGDAATDWHTISVAEIPRITSIAADIEAGTQDPPYHEDVREFALEVLEGAEVTLTVETSEPVSEVTVVDASGEERSVASDSGPSFQHRFTATEPGMMRFALRGESGLVNDKEPPLQIILHGDGAPEFELETPGGDYLATNVASVPLQIKVTDDYGLDSAELMIEVPGSPPIRVPGAVERGARETVLAHTLELEDYDLVLGDAILFHAEAKDIATGIKAEGETAAGDIYFIEIKPYRQVWHQPPPSLPSEFGKPGLGSMFEAHAGMLAVLEYTRAILKKTWPLANDTELDERERGQVASIAKDAGHVQEQTRLIKEDPRYRFSSEQIGMLAEVEGHFAEAQQHLLKTDAAAAVPPEKDAYQKLRMLVRELEKSMMSGSGGSPQQGPERLKMEEQVHLTRFEKEQEQWELKRLANSLAQIREQQEQIKERFDQFMKDYGKQEGHAQSTTDEESWRDPNAQTAQSESSGGGGEQGRTTLEGALEPSQGGSGSAPPAPVEASQNRASTQDRLEMMRAQEAALRQQAAQLAEELSGQANSSEDTQAALEQLKLALEAMEDFDEAAADAFFTGSEDSLNQAAQSLMQSMRHFDTALFALQRAALLDEQERASKEMMAQAESMARLARALDGVTDPAERADLLAQLEQAEQQFLEQGGPDYVNHFGGAGRPPNYTSLTRSLVPGTDKSNLPTDWQDLEPPREARWLAEQYMTMAIAAQKQSGELRKYDPSDPGFVQLEEQFFERAAQYEPGGAL